MKLLAPFCMPVLCAALAAQEPASPIVRLHLAGPAAFRQAFLPTNLGGVLAGDEAAPVIDRWMKLVEPVFGPLKKSGAWDLLGGYRGQIDCEVFLSGTANAPTFALAVRMTADGRTDLEAMAVSFSNILVGVLGDASGEVEHGDDSFGLFDTGSLRVTVPCVRGGELVLLVGTDLEANGMVLGCDSLDAMSRRPALRRAAPFSVDVDLQQIAEVELAEQDWFSREFREILFGTRSLRTLRLAALPAGPQIMLEAAVHFEGTERGVWGGLFPERVAKCTLHGLVPEHVQNWKVGQLEPGVMYRSLVEAWAQDQGKEIADTEEQMRDLLQFDPGKFCAALDTEALLIFGDWFGEGAGGGEELDGTCLVFRVKDSESMASVWASAGNVMEMLSGRGSESTHADEVILSRSGGMIPDFELHSCLTEKLAIFALGDEGLRTLHGVLDRRSADAAELPPAIQRAASQRPKGHNGMALATAEMGIAGQIGLILSLIDEYGPAGLIGVDAYDLAKAIREVEGVLVDNDLGHVVSFTGHEAGNWVLRILW